MNSFDRLMEFHGSHDQKSHGDWADNPYPELSPEKIKTPFDKLSKADQAKRRAQAEALLNNTDYDEVEGLYRAGKIAESQWKDWIAITGRWT